MSLMLPATEIEESVVSNLSGGEVIVTRGGVVSSVTSMLAVPTAPVGAVAVAVMTFGPSANGTGVLKTPLPAGATIVFTITVAAGSSTVPVTVVGLIFRKL